MRSRRAIVGLLIAVLSGAFWLQAPTASASCYPQKPETCRTCELRGPWIDESGNITFEWYC